MNYVFGTRVSGISAGLPRFTLLIMAKPPSLVGRCRIPVSSDSKGSPISGDHIGFFPKSTPFQERLGGRIALVTDLNNRRKNGQRPITCISKAEVMMGCAAPSLARP